MPFIEINHPGLCQLTQRLNRIAQYFNDTSRLLLPGQRCAECFITHHQSYLVPMNAQQRLVLELSLESQVPVGFSLWRMGANELERLSAGIFSPDQSPTLRRDVCCDEEGALLMQLVVYEPCSAISITVAVSAPVPLTTLTPLYQRIPSIFSRLWEPANVPTSELVQI